MVRNHCQAPDGSCDYANASDAGIDANRPDCRAADCYYCDHPARVFVVQVSSGFLNTVAGIFLAISSGRGNAPAAIVGYLLYALVGLYELIIFARIIGTWFSVSYANRTMRFLTQSTEPLLAPLRRAIPTVGMFDISPIIAFLICWLIQAAIAGTILKGWPVQFF